MLCPHWARQAAPLQGLIDTLSERGLIGQLQYDEALQILLEAAGLGRLDDNTSVIASDCIQSAISEYENW